MQVVHQLAHTTHPRIAFLTGKRPSGSTLEHVTHTHLLFELVFSVHEQLVTLSSNPLLLALLFDDVFDLR
jgi:hypothetical protein